jgi:hypothetical protein
MFAFPFGSSLLNIYIVQLHVFLCHSVFDDVASFFSGSVIVNVFHKYDCTDLISLLAKSKDAIAIAY